MLRAILPEDRIHPSIRQKIAENHRAIVAEVEEAVEQHKLVVVGMAQNPFVKKARRALDGAGIPYHYLEYGSYLSLWRKRNALKMFTGWPTFPMCFYRGMLIGGAEELINAIESGEIER